MREVVRRDQVEDAKEGETSSQEVCQHHGRVGKESVRIVHRTWNPKQSALSCVTSKNKGSYCVLEVACRYKHENISSHVVYFQGGPTGESR